MAKVLPWEERSWPEVRSGVSSFGRLRKWEDELASSFSNPILYTSVTKETGGFQDTERNFEDSEIGIKGTKCFRIICFFETKCQKIHSGFVWYDVKQLVYT